MSLQVLRSVGPRVARCTARPVSAPSALLAATAALMEQRRHAGMASIPLDPTQKPENRFLGSHHPLHVMGLPDEGVQREEIEQRYQEMKLKYGPTSPYPDLKRWKLVEESYRMLMNPNSLFYNRIGPANPDMKRLQLDVMPKKDRQNAMLGLTSIWAMFFVFGGMILYSGTLFPSMRIRHTALRGINADEDDE